MTRPRTAVVAATAAGRVLAGDLATHLGADLEAGRPRDAVAAAWSNAEAIVLVVATGAATRLVAPHLTDKRRDPAVVCVDDAGRFVVPLVGGHEAGANHLAERIAAFLDATPVVTTASEAAGWPSLGALGGRAGLRAEGDLAAVGGHLLSGGAVRIVRDAAWPLGPLPFATTDEPTAPLLHVTDRAASSDPVPTVRYRPPSLVVGIGASRGVTAGEVGELVDAALADAGLSPLAVHTVATVDAKADEAGILDAAAERGWPVVCLPASRLAGTEVPNPSDVVRAAVGTPSVSEAAALHLGGDLVVEKRRSAMATVAVARRPARGRLALVSLGPGAEDLVTPRARAELGDAEVVVGYGPYVDQAAAFTRRGVRFERFGLGEEVARAERAVALARAGHAVALVGSGDVGVYAMASPTLERAEGIDVAVVPGVTAALAASALLGAPFGHDHCSISLSTLLTPWEAIAPRIEAAAASDLAIAFYNPRSRGRDWQLEEARRMLLRHRSPDTPVGIVRDAERPDQEVRLTTLGDLDVAHVQMTTVVLVGTSLSRVVDGRIVTPRGYVDAPGQVSA